MNVLKNLHFRSPFAIFSGLPKDCSKNVQFRLPFAIFSESKAVDGK